MLRACCTSRHAGAVGATCDGCWEHTQLLAGLRTKSRALDRQALRAASPHTHFRRSAQAGRPKLRTQHHQQVQGELSRVLYPVFLHCYLRLVAHDNTPLAKAMFDKWVGVGVGDGSARSGLVLVFGWCWAGWCMVRAAALQAAGHTHCSDSLCPLWSAFLPSSVPHHFHCHPHSRHSTCAGSGSG